MKMRRRQNMREKKQEVKGMIKMKRLFGDKLTDQQEDIMKLIQESTVKQEEAKAIDDKKDIKKAGFDQ
jgi:hypothetical protein